MRGLDLHEAVLAHQLIAKQHTILIELKIQFKLFESSNSYNNLHDCSTRLRLTLNRVVSRSVLHVNRGVAETNT